MITGIPNPKTTHQKIENIQSYNLDTTSILSLMSRTQGQRIILTAKGTDVLRPFDDNDDVSST